MARHNIYVSDATVELLDELGMTRDGWSPLLNRALDQLIASQPEVKVRRAVGRIARRQARDRTEQLLGSSDA